MATNVVPAAWLTSLSGILSRYVLEMPSWMKRQIAICPIPTSKLNFSNGDVEEVCACKRPDNSHRSFHLIVLLFHLFIQNAIVVTLQFIKDFTSLLLATDAVIPSWCVRN